MEQLKFSGSVVSGAGEGAAFTQFSWARGQFIAKLGIDPFPGTLNLFLENPADLAKWANLKKHSKCLVKAPDPNWCNARCYPVRIADRLPGAIIFPEVPGYPDAQVGV